ncbi:MAG TPA: anti-sigma factor [Opitutaceae bacterium]
MSSPTSKPSIAAWAGWAVAATLALIASYFAAVSFGARAQLSVQKDRADLDTLELRSLRQSLEANRIIYDRQIADLQHGSSLEQLKTILLSAPGESARESVAIAIWDSAKQEGVLSVRGLPKIASDQIYQLWLIDAGRKLSVSAALFSIDEKGRARITFRSVEHLEPSELTITREAAGGASTPSSVIVASGAL